MMSETEIAENARRLCDVHGDKAGRKAAYNELEAEENGDDTEAANWHRICVAIQQMPT
jgi:hypothetical protein